MMEKLIASSNLRARKRTLALQSWRTLGEYLKITIVDDVHDVWALFNEEAEGRQRKQLMIALLRKARALDTKRWVANIRARISAKPRRKY